MAAIRSQNTLPEKRLRQTLWHAGLRGYRLQARLPGRPDIVFSRKHVAIFVDGCFWHRCPTCYREPKTHVSYWTAKIQRNVDRDQRVTIQLTENGWAVIRIWEHHLRTAEGLEECLRLIQTCLISRQ